MILNKILFCIEFFGFPNGNLQYNHAIVADISRKWKNQIGGLDKKGKFS